MGLFKKARQKISKATGVKFANPMKDPLKAFTQIALAPITVPTAGLFAAGKYAVENTMETFGMKESDADKAKREAEEGAAAEEAARAGAFNDALSDSGLDAISRQEIAQMYGAGANSQNIASYLQAARSGKGVFGVRSINEAQSKLSGQTPGRRATLGTGSLL